MLSILLSVWVFSADRLSPGYDSTPVRYACWPSPTPVWSDYIDEHEFPFFVNCTDYAMITPKADDTRYTIHLLGKEPMFISYVSGQIDKGNCSGDYLLEWTNGSNQTQLLGSPVVDSVW